MFCACVALRRLGSACACRPAVALFLVVGADARVCLTCTGCQYGVEGAVMVSGPVGYHSLVPGFPLRPLPNVG